MAATTLTAQRPLPAEPRLSPQLYGPTLPWSLLLPILTAVAVLVNGYHPLAEDGGLYVAGIEYLLDPTLFPHYTAFVTAHLRYSVFAPAMAMIVHVTRLPLTWALMLGYVLSLWLLLFAGRQIMRRCALSPLAQRSAVSLLAVWSTLPVAGTSLLLIDPYLTARSFTTPLSLLAIAYALDEWRSSRSAWLCALCLTFAALLHPLMAIYALAIVILLRLLHPRHTQRQALLLCSGFVFLAVLVTALAYALAPIDTAPIIAASLSRYYWFLSQWQWYELCGLLGPFVILFFAQRGQRDQPASSVRRLCNTSLIAGSIAILLALLFAREHGHTYLIARLQPLRVFLLIYALMTLVLGATTVDRFQRHLPDFIRKAALLPITIIILSAAGLFAAQRATFPNSQHIEAPWLTPANPWSRAFNWIRLNTPQNALFALDADYISTPGEDAQTFRATAQRSALPDFSKDGGEASISPSLTSLWQQSLAAQFAVQSGTHLIARNMLSSQTDAERDAHLRPLGVTWMVLLISAHTSHPCPYSNSTVKVCNLSH
jgi:hypothetical protein